MILQSSIIAASDPCTEKLYVPHFQYFVDLLWLKVQLICIIFGNEGDDVMLVFVTCTKACALRFVLSICPVMSSLSIQARVGVGAS